MAGFRGGGISRGFIGVGPGHALVLSQHATGSVLLIKNKLGGSLIADVGVCRENDEGCKIQKIAK